MKTPPRHPLNEAQREALEARFAMRLSARLEAGTQSLPHDITERLRVARAQATALARPAPVRVAQIASAAQTNVGLQLAGAGAGGSQGTGGLAGWTGRALARATGRGRQIDDGPLGWGWRLASALPVVALVVGLWGIHTWYRHEQVQAATDVDMALLTDDLPPSAYSDPGFEEFLRSNDSNADSAPLVEPATESTTETDHETT